VGFDATSSPARAPLAARAKRDVADRTRHSMRSFEELSVDRDRATNPGTDGNRKTQVVFTSSTQASFCNPHRMRIVDGHRWQSESALKLRLKAHSGPSRQQIGGKNDLPGGSVNPSASGDADSRRCRHSGIGYHAVDQPDRTLQDGRCAVQRLSRNNSSIAHETLSRHEGHGYLGAADVDSRRGSSRHVKSTRGVIAISNTRFHGSVGGSMLSPIPIL
jgi:hypothetical protein